MQGTKFLSKGHIIIGRHYPGQTPKTMSCRGKPAGAEAICFPLQKLETTTTEEKTCLCDVEEHFRPISAVNLFIIHNNLGQRNKIGGITSE